MKNLKLTIFLVIGVAFFNFTSCISKSALNNTKKEYENRIDSLEEIFKYQLALQKNSRKKDLFLGSYEFLSSPIPISVQDFKKQVKWENINISTAIKKGDVDINNLMLSFGVSQGYNSENSLEWTDGQNALKLMERHNIERSLTKFNYEVIYLIGNVGIDSVNYTILVGIYYGAYLSVKTRDTNLSISDVFNSEYSSTETKFNAQLTFKNLGFSGQLPAHWAIDKEDMKISLVYKKYQQMSSTLTKILRTKNIDPKTTYITPHIIAFERTSEMGEIEQDKIRDKIFSALEEPKL